MATDLNLNKFYPFIKNHHIAIVDFYTTWCDACNRFKKITLRLEDKLAKRAFLGMVDVEEERLLKQMFDIKKVPTFIFFVNGKEAFRQEGKIMTMVEIEKKVIELGG